MKKLILNFAMIVTTLTLLALTPQTFKYQAVVRDNSGPILSNQSVSFRISIRTDSPNGSIVYQETKTITTNQLGFANLNIGDGPPTIGTFRRLTGHSV